MPSESPPSTPSGEGGDSDGKDQKADAKDENVNGTSDSKAPANGKKAKGDDGKEVPKDIPVYPDEKPVSIDASNLKEFFYLACGEEPALYLDADNANSSKRENGTKSKKKGKKGKDATSKSEEEKDEIPVEQSMRETIPRLNELEEKTRIPCTIQFSGFHPPPPFRRLMGDLAYLEITVAGEAESIHVTAVPTGFFVNRSSSSGGKYTFDPSPAAQPCFSHELLDCLLQRS